MSVENNLPKGWVETTLGEVSKVQTGPFGSQLLKEQYITGGTPVVTVEHIDDFRIIDFDYPSVTDEDKERLSKYLLKEGDIIFTRVGSVDLSAYVAKEQDGWMFSSRMLSVRTNRDVDSKFLSYFFRQISFRKYIHRISVGATMPSINTSILKSIPISYPSKQEQQAIASILTTFDDKIELLQAQNETLETIAQTIFKEWFGKYQVGDELPEGWRVEGLSDIAAFLNGLALQKYPPIEGEETLPVIKIRELRQGITSNTDRANKRLDTKYIVNNGDVLFSWSGSLEVIIWQNGEGALNQHLFKVTSDVYPKWFYYFWTMHHLNMFRAIASDKATTMGHINRKHLDLAEVVIPNDATLKSLDKLFVPLMEKIETNAQQIQTLQQTRDTLLPKLMSGKVRVDEFKE